MSTASRKWVQLVVCLVSLIVVSNIQYGWTLFVLPIQDHTGWSRPNIQWAFACMIFMQTWFVPFEGYLVDRIGPRPIVFCGGILMAIGWVLCGNADTLTLLYVGSALAGLGSGTVLGSCYGNIAKWFGERRGLALGITAAGYGAGTALTIIPIAALIRKVGYADSFVICGLGIGVSIVLLSLFLRSPGTREGEPDTPTVLRESSCDLTPKEALVTPTFWLLYLMFVLVASGGLMVVAQLAVMAKDYGVDSHEYAFFGMTLGAVTIALSLDRITNGASRIFFGWVSDKIGREFTMFAAFLLEAACILLLVRYAHDPVLFIILTAFVFFAWGEIFSLFPATCTDAFGRTHATTIYGLLYTAKGATALLVPYGNVLASKYGWHTVFYSAACFDTAAALLAVCVLLPWRTLRRKKASVC